jgi:hypothetical protein
MSVSLDILAALKPSFPSLKVVLDQPARINVAQWRLVEERTGHPEVAYALRALPNLVTRRCIIGLRDPDPCIRRRRVVIAALMWGYGISGARWGDQWVSDISDFLLRPDLDDVLAGCEKTLANGAIAEPYKLFTRPGRGSIEEENFHGLGSSFFTKILYFLARNVLAGSISEYPLILDTKVSWALAQMTGYRLLVRPVGYRARPDSEAYARYVRTMHAWAARLDVRAEVIEYYLWSEAGKRGSQLWAECEAQYTLHFP